MRPFVAVLRVFLVALVLVISGVATHAGELKTSIVNIPQTCVGQEFKFTSKIENINASFGVHDVVVTAQVRQGLTLLCTKALPKFDLSTSASNTVEIATGWIVPATGVYTVSVSADGSDDINGPQIAISTLTACASNPCPERPTASGDVIYLGTGSSGQITYSVPSSECCYDMKVTVVTGRDAVVSKTPAEWTRVGPSTPVSVEIDRSKWNGSYVTLRVDWRKCDRSASGSDYVLVRDGTQATASAPTTQPAGITAGNAPHTGVDGDPVLTGHREFAHTCPVDISAISSSEMEMTRTYQSLLDYVSNKDHDFGPGWTHPYDWNAVTGDGEVYVNGPGGFTARFRKDNTNWKLDWPQSQPLTLTIKDVEGLSFYNGLYDVLVEFSGDGRLRKIGRTNAYMNDVQWNGRWISSVTSPSGRGLRFTRDTAGRITSISNRVNSVSYGYENGNLTSFRDGTGSRTFYYYVPGTSLLTHWKTPEGRTPFTNTYTSDRITRQDFGEGFVLDFSQTGNTTTITYPGGVSIEHEHDPNTQLTKVTTPFGSSSFVYNGLRQRTGISDMLGNQTQRTYENGWISTTENANGTEWDAARSAVTQQSQIARLTQFGSEGYPQIRLTHDAVGRPTHIEAPYGFTEELRYDVGPLPTSIIAGDRNSRYEYDVDGLIKKFTPASGDVYNYERDSSGHITTIKVGPTTWTYGYDRNHNLVSRSNFTSLRKWEYDRDRLLTEYTSEDNMRWLRTYDSRGRVSELISPTGPAVKYVWTGTTLTGLQFATGAAYSLTPGLGGLPTEVTDERGNEWGFDFNPELRIRAWTPPDGNKVSLKQDAMGRTTEIATASGLKYEYTYDPIGVMSGYRMPGRPAIDVTRSADYQTGTLTSGSITTGYQTYWDGTKLVTKITDGGGFVWTRMLQRDSSKVVFVSPSGRTTILDLTPDNTNIERIEWGPSATGLFTYTNNHLSRIRIDTTDRMFLYNRVGQLTSVGGDTVRRDSAGRILQQNNVTRAFDANGNVQSYYWPNTFKPIRSRYGFDTDAYLTSVYDQAGGETKVAYDGRGRNTSLDMPGGFKVNYDYNTDDQIIKISTNDGWSITLERDAQGRLISRTRTDDVELRNMPMPVDRRQTYDQDNRVTEGTYDRFGNLSSAQDVGMYTFDGVNATTADAGNQILTLKWDAYGYPSAITGSGTTTSFVYNHIPSIKSPIAKVTGTDTTVYVTLPNGRVIYSLNPQGVRTFFLDDGLGNIIAERSSSGEYTAARVFTPFGETVASSGTAGELGFKGLDGALTYGNIVLDNGKIYSPTLGRFINRVGIIPDFPLTTNPLSASPQVMQPMMYTSTPTISLLESGNPYKAECTFGPTDVAPPLDDAEKPDYQKISDLYGSGFYYMPGTDILVRLNDHLPRRESYDIIDLLRMGYSPEDAYYNSGNGSDWRLDVDKEVRAHVDYGVGNIFSKNMFGRDYGYSPFDNGAPYSYAEPDKSSIGADVDIVREGLFPRLDDLFSTMPTPDAQSNNSTPRAK